MVENVDSYTVILAGAAMSRFGTPHETYEISKSTYPNNIKATTSDETVSVFYDTMIIDTCELGEVLLILYHH